MNEVITLIGNAGERDVFCRLASIGQREYYEAQAVDVYPECKFILADYLEYENEQLLEYDGQRYHVLRTYRNGVCGGGRYLWVKASKWAICRLHFLMR